LNLRALWLWVSLTSGVLTGWVLFAMQTPAAPTVMLLAVLPPALTAGGFRINQRALIHLAVAIGTGLCAIAMLGGAPAFGVLLAFGTTLAAWVLARAASRAEAYRPADPAGRPASLPARIDRAWLAAPLVIGVLLASVSGLLQTGLPLVTLIVLTAVLVWAISRAIRVQ
jgi:hypothetical protein